ncbi:MAG: hypothetical protein ACODAB_03950 [Gemmatimonadota bacterium]
MSERKHGSLGSPADDGVTELVLPGRQASEVAPDVSVIVPVTERPEPLVDIYLEYAGAIADSGRSLEFLFVIEPFWRHTVESLRVLAARGEPIRVIEAGHTVGESILLKLGGARARGSVLVVLPAYHRVVAGAIPELIDAVEQGADLANGRRWPRRDSWVNRLQTRVLHTMVTGLASGQIHDVGSGVRAMRPDVLRDLPLYGDFFRFLPVLALRDGYSVVEIDAEQHPNDARVRVYSPGTYLRRAIDVFGLFFLSRFTYKPLRFFGLIGTMLGAAGGTILFIMFLERLGGQGLADRPMLLLAVLLFTLGVQAVALGLIGEIIVHFNAPGRRPYRVADDDRRAAVDRAASTAAEAADLADVTHVAGAGADDPSSRRTSG